MKKIMRIMLIWPVLFLAACSTGSIGLKTDFQQANFEVGKSTKTDVVNYLGLPQKVIKDPEGREHYLYEGSTRLVGLCVGCGDTRGVPGLIPSYINQAGIENGAEYVFDLQGLLATKFEPKN
jgi:hypothetical protein